LDLAPAVYYLFPRMKKPPWRETDYCQQKRRKPVALLEGRRERRAGRNVSASTTETTAVCSKRSNHR
jgi:hypothetical protein